MFSQFFKACFFSLIALFVIGQSHSILAAPASKLIPEWNASSPENSASIDHSLWQSILDSFVSSSSIGINLVNYEQLANQREKLNAYIATLGQTDPRQFSQAEQFAYWVNLYNAATVQLIVDHYPVKSITKIKGGFFSFGPWDKKWINVVSNSLSLNDIEHGILRPIWNDPRIHYAVNCASIGCPNLAKTAFTAENSEKLLEQAAQAFINHPRGISINLEDKKVNYSSIFHWYKVDFGNSFEGLLSHWSQYANAELMVKIDALKQKNSVKQNHSYDWNLNN